jgi:hypothetical protein
VSEHVSEHAMTAEQLVELRAKVRDDIQAMLRFGHRPRRHTDAELAAYYGTPLPATEGNT